MPIIKLEKSEVYDSSHCKRLFGNQSAVQWMQNFIRIPCFALLFHYYWNLYSSTTKYFERFRSVLQFDKQFSKIVHPIKISAVEVPVSRNYEKVTAVNSRGHEKNEMHENELASGCNSFSHWWFDIYRYANVRQQEQGWWSPSNKKMMQRCVRPGK